MSDLEALLTKSGLELLDAAAAVVGFDVKPSEWVKELVTANPTILDRLKNDWAWVAPELDDLRVDLDAHWQAALDTWHGPAARNFAAYMPRLVDLIEAEEKAIGKFPEHLENMQKAVEDAQIEQRRQDSQTQKEIGLAVMGAIVGGVVGILTGGIVSAAAITAAVGAILAALGIWLNHSNGIRNSRNDKLRTINGELKSLVEAVKGINVKEVGKPTIVTPGFSFSQIWDEHQPPQVPRVSG